jgi:peptide deformylase
MATQEILQLGHPGLRQICSPVTSFAADELHALIVDLADTLSAFRSAHGFGRGIAAPQIGSTTRVIVLNIDRPQVLINPRVVKRSRKLMTLWDDCFSFPNLLVKVRRSLTVAVRYQDEQGRRHVLRAEAGLAELLQHEIDHLDGVLAIDRAIDSRHIVFREEYERWLKSTDMRF